jgi:motility quorum-sensing regulator/GCU-specific mRNA interferase toxin
MEKPSPHYRLSTVKSLISSGHVRATITAANCAKALGVSGLPDMCEIVLSRTRGDFYKSMRSHSDHRVWQDVYYGRTTEGAALYIKLTVVDDVLILSFKEL